MIITNRTRMSSPRWTFACCTLLLLINFRRYHHLGVSGFQLKQLHCQPSRYETVICTSSQTEKDNTSPSTSTSLEQQTPKDYFVSKALFVHLSPAAHILTEAFYSHRTNFITFQIEKLKTALSLESTFDKQRINPVGQMFVACSSYNGKVVGFAEVDTCSLKKDCNELKECGVGNENERSIPRPYMYNLAVDKQWQRRGIATALVTECEKFVANIEWKQYGSDETILVYKEMGYSDTTLRTACEKLVNNLEEKEQWLYLRVREGNEEAITFYESLGYREIDPISIALTKDDVNSNSAEEGELILMGKELM